MQPTSDLYRSILSGTHWKEIRLVIGDSGVLINERGSRITFGGVNILVATGGADDGYDDSRLFMLKTRSAVFSASTPTVGDCVSGQIDVEMLKPAADIPKQARMVPYVRLTDGIRHSEWLQKGVYYIDTRKNSVTQAGEEILTLTGYDSMMKAEQDYPSSTMDWPARDIDVVREIAAFMGVAVDQRTVELMTEGYPINYPAGYSCRETLGGIAALYGGCFIMSDLGELRLVTLYGIPKETNYLIDHAGFAILIGGDHILV